MFLTEGKTSLWNVKGSNREQDDDCDFEKPAAERKKEKPLRDMLNKTFATVRKGFHTNYKAQSGVRVN